MSDLANSGSGPITRTIAGALITFVELTMRDRINLVNKWRRAERDALKEMLSEAGVEPVDQIPDLRQFDREIVGSWHFLRGFESYAGKADIFAASIAKTAGQPDGLELFHQVDWPDEELTSVCALICRVQLKQDKRGDGSENPTAKESKETLALVKEIHKATVMLVTANPNLAKAAK